MKESILSKMKRLFNPAIMCTDPDQLQFCLKISENKFWYCEPNIYRDDLLPETNSPNSRIYHKYLGNPKQFLLDARVVPEVQAFAIDEQFWLEDEIDINGFSRQEQEELLDDYGYKWDDFECDSDRNLIICENHFEQYPLDYRNDI